MLEYTAILIHLAGHWEHLWEQFRLITVLLSQSILYTFCSLFCNYLQYSTAHGDKLSKLLLELHPRESRTYYISAIFCFIIDIGKANDYSVAVALTILSCLHYPNNVTHFLVNIFVISNVDHDHAWSWPMGIQQIVIFWILCKFFCKYVHQKCMAVPKGWVTPRLFTPVFRLSHVGLDHLTECHGS